MGWDEGSGCCGSRSHCGGVAFPAPLLFKPCKLFLDRSICGVRWLQCLRAGVLKQGLAHPPLPPWICRAKSTCCTGGDVLAVGSSPQRDRLWLGHPLSAAPPSAPKRRPRAPPLPNATSVSGQRGRWPDRTFAGGPSPAAEKVEPCHESCRQPAALTPLPTNTAPPPAPTLLSP